MAEAWHYDYTDFGEGTGRSPQPVLRAVVGVATPGAPSRFAAIIDTGGPITVVASEMLVTGGDPVRRSETMLLRLGGSTNEVGLYDLTLEIRPRAHRVPVRSRGEASLRCSIPGHTTAPP